MGNKKKKIVLITVIVSILAIIGSVGGYTVYTQAKIKERSAEVKADIADTWEKFTKKEDRNKKLEVFKKLSTSKSAYQKEEHRQKEVLKDFENTLKKMKTFFSKDYDKVISENTLTDIDNISDKVKITTAKENLEKLLETIESENDTLKLKKLAEKTTPSKELIEKYTNRIKVIEEEEAKKKAEEEARKKAEEEANAVNSNNNNNSNSNSSGNNYNGSSNNSSSSSSNSGNSNNSGESSTGGRYVVETYTYTDSNGVTTTKITYSDGTVEFVFPDGTVEDITGNGDIFG